jgi:AcrR family transcriptional regulator
MNEVAEACGVTKPSLYHYFRDKQQLLLEIAAAHVARSRRSSPRSAPRRTRPRRGCAA